MLAVLQTLLLSHRGHKTKWPSFSKKFPEGFLFSGFFSIFLNVTHSTGIISKNGDDVKILPRIAFLLTTSTTLFSFTPATRNLIKSYPSKLCISPKHLCLLASCETSAKEWKLKTQIKEGKKKTQCPKEELEEQNNYADNKIYDSFNSIGFKISYRENHLRSLLQSTKARKNTPLSLEHKDY